MSVPGAAGHGRRPSSYPPSVLRPCHDLEDVLFHCLPCVSFFRWHVSDARYASRLWSWAADFVCFYFSSICAYYICVYGDFSGWSMDNSPGADRSLPLVAHFLPLLVWVLFLQFSLRNLTDMPQVPKQKGRRGITCYISQKEVQLFHSNNMPNINLILAE